MMENLEKNLKTVKKATFNTVSNSFRYAGVQNITIAAFIGTDAS